MQVKQAITSVDAHICLHSIQNPFWRNLFKKYMDFVRVRQMDQTGDIYQPVTLWEEDYKRSVVEPTVDITAITDMLYHAQLLRFSHVHAPDHAEACVTVALGKPIEGIWVKDEYHLDHNRFDCNQIYPTHNISWYDKNLDPDKVRQVAQDNLFKLNKWHMLQLLVDNCPDA